MTEEPAEAEAPTPTVVASTTPVPADPTSVRTPTEPPAPSTLLPSISDLVEAVEPAVVAISVESIEQGLFFSFTNQGGATGMIIDPSGYIVTNYHVIEGARDIKVHVPNGDTYDAKIMGLDQMTDLAVLKIDAENLPSVTFADSRTLRVGDWVVAVGNALALKGGPTVTIGIVSALGRRIQTQRDVELFDLVQTDAAINEGNSGGPLLNLDGEVVGINTVILEQAQAIGFAISSFQAKPIIQKLIDDGRVVRPLIGFLSIDVTSAIASDIGLPMDEGVIVTRMSADGPAFRAGIRVGDVITKLDGIPTPDQAGFLLRLWSYLPGDVVQVDYYSGGENKTADVTLVERPN